MIFVLKYIHIGSKAVTGSMYGNPNKTVHLTNVDCSGLEDTLTDCDAVHIPFEDGRELYKVVHVAGVMCKTLDTLSSTTISPTTIRSLGVNEESTLTGPSIALMIVCVFFLFGVITAVRQVVLKLHIWAYMSLCRNHCIEPVFSWFK